MTAPAPRSIITDVAVVPTPSAPVAVAATGGFTVLAAAVAAACLYEVAAQAVNNSLDMDVLPSFSTTWQGVTLRKVAAKSRPPPWTRTGATMGVGFGYYALTGRRRGRGG
jgi:hypothetical protein